MRKPKRRFWCSPIAYRRPSVDDENAAKTLVWTQKRIVFKIRQCERGLIKTVLKAGVILCQFICYSKILIRLVLVSFCFQFSIIGCRAQLNQTKIEQTLIKALFANYDSEGRPVLNLSKPVLVRFGLAYSNLQSLVCIKQVTFSFTLCSSSYQNLGRLVKESAP